MSVLSKLKLSVRNIVATMTPTPTPAPTATPTPSPTPTITPTPLPISITSQFSSGTYPTATSNQLYVTFSHGAGNVVETWELKNGSGTYSKTLTRYTTTHTSMPAGTNTFYYPYGLDNGTFTGYGYASNQYYNDNGAGYYKCTLTLGSNSVNTGWIQVNTENCYECNCGCKDYPGGPVVGSWECYGGENCSDNCCCYDCNGDGITCCDGGNPVENCCRAECSPGDPGSACGQTCNCPTYYACTSGNWYCDSCCDAINYPQYSP